MKLLVFIKSSGPNVNVDNLRDTLTSFDDKNKGVDYKFYLVVDQPLSGFVKKLFSD
jgi:hypothetical protein